jgi:phage N-6-adenine-methyltransferase
MDGVTTLATQHSVIKIGRPTIRKDGRPLTAAERQARYRARLKRERRKSHRARGTGWNEWYTPAPYIEAARAVLGEIDLDPATSEIAQMVIRARAVFTKEDDGLSREWFGHVWLNPPYAQPLISLFTTKMVEEITAGRVQAAIMLTHAYTDTEWFRQTAKVAAAICYSKRIRFWAPDGRANASPTQGQAFFYFGPDVDRFQETFNEFGFVTTLS